MAISAETYEVILSHGNKPVYHTFVLLASLCGTYLIRKDSAAWMLARKSVWLLFAVAVLGALIGSAVPAFFAGGVIENRAWDAYISPKTVMGGILFSFLFVSLFNRFSANKVDTSDAFARGAISMMLIGRLGCIFQHCCFGIEVSWGIDFGDGVLRAPVQMIEAVVLLVIFVMIHYFHVKQIFKGQRLFLLFLTYGVVRFVLEFYREPIADSHYGLGFYQWIAFTIAGIGLWQVFKRANYHFAVNR